MEKVKFLFGVDAPGLKGMEQEDLDLLILIATKDYIDFLKSSGELTDADVDLMKNNPEIVSELDGFREYLSGYLKKAMKQYKQEV
jgi:RNA processing factor Prp31